LQLKSPASFSYSGAFVAAASISSGFAVNFAARILGAPVKVDASGVPFADTQLDNVEVQINVYHSSSELASLMRSTLACSSSNAALISSSTVSTSASLSSNSK
jgi:hypothetical protein